MPRPKKTQLPGFFDYRNGFKFIPNYEIDIYIDPKGQLYSKLEDLCDLMGVKYGTVRKRCGGKTVLKRRVSTSNGTKDLFLRPVSEFYEWMSTNYDLQEAFDQLIKGNHVNEVAPVYAGVNYQTVSYKSIKGGDVKFPGYVLPGETSPETYISVNQIANICSVWLSEMMEYLKLNSVSTYQVFDAYDGEYYHAVKIKDSEIVFSDYAERGAVKALCALMTMRVESC